MGLAVVAGCIIAVVRSVARHKVRLAMIQRGMNPDESVPGSIGEDEE